MTMPHMMNCAHSDDGWCLNCVIKLNSRVEAAEAQLVAIRAALGGYPDSDLASLATALRARAEYTENECEEANEYIDEVIDECAIHPHTPLVERIRLLVSVLANRTTPAELDAVVNASTVDALARRVEELDGRVDAHDARLDMLDFSLTSNAHRYGDTVRRIVALERFAAATADAIATQLKYEHRYQGQLNALEPIVSDLQQLATKMRN